jgi:hypothetical protein
MLTATDQEKLPGIESLGEIASDQTGCLPGNSPVFEGGPYELTSRPLRTDQPVTASRLVDRHQLGGKVVGAARTRNLGDFSKLPSVQPVKSNTIGSWHRIGVVATSRKRNTQPPNQGGHAPVGVIDPKGLGKSSILESGFRKQFHQAD